MKGILLTASCFVLCLLADAEARGANSPHCMTLEKAQKAAGKDTAIAALTPAQFHFLQGMYVAMPTTPEGLPPGDGALILTRDKTDEGIILWMRGILACEPMPISHAAKLLEILAEVKAESAGRGGEL